MRGLSLSIFACRDICSQLRSVLHVAMCSSFKRQLCLPDMRAIKVNSCAIARGGLHHLRHDPGNVDFGSWVDLILSCFMTTISYWGVESLICTLWYGWISCASLGIVPLALRLGGAGTSILWFMSHWKLWYMIALNTYSILTDKQINQILRGVIAAIWALFNTRRKYQC